MNEKELERALEEAETTRVKIESALLNIRAEKERLEFIQKTHILFVEFLKELKENV